MVRDGGTSTARVSGLKSVEVNIAGCCRVRCEGEGREDDGGEDEACHCYLKDVFVRVPFFAGR